MEIAQKYLIVYLAGATGIWKGIPVGIALGIQPVFNGLITALGSVSSVLILYFAGDNFRNWILKLYGQKRIEKKKNKFMKFANRYGVLGLGLITTGLLGPFTSLILGFILIKDIRKFLFYLIAGIFIWSLILAFFFTSIVEMLS
jgi:membrane protein DedA with SNARE-associated domain